MRNAGCACANAIAPSRTVKRHRKRSGRMAPLQWMNLLTGRLSYDASASGKGPVILLLRRQSIRLKSPHRAVRPSGMKAEHGRMVFQ